MVSVHFEQPVGQVEHTNTPFNVVLYVPSGHYEIQELVRK